jgi:hypothetical protein
MADQRVDKSCTIEQSWAEATWGWGAANGIKEILAGAPQSSFSAFISGVVAKAR